MISYESGRGDISVTTERGAEPSSHLVVRRARPSDSGLYTCAPSNAQATRTRVHVLHGERRAAQFRGGERPQTAVQER